ncbi:hypothetical protein ACFB49_08350 [Sphingomonas sp. DBB INV C78]
MCAGQHVDAIDLKESQVIDCSTQMRDRRLFGVTGTKALRGERDPPGFLKGDGGGHE